MMLRVPRLAALACFALLPFSAHALDPFSLDQRVPPLPPSLETGTDIQMEGPLCRGLPEGALLNLADVVDQALCNHPSTRESWVNARIQAGLLGVAQSAYLPDVNASVTTSRKRNEGNTFNQNASTLTLSYLLYDFGGRAANLENSEQLLNAALSSYDAARQTVLLNVLQAFYQAHAAQASVTAAFESERAAQTGFQAAEARYLAGTATSADKLQAKAAYSQAVLTRIKAQGSMENAMGALANSMGLDAQSRIKLAPVEMAFPTQNYQDFERDLDRLIMEARDRRPDLQAAAARFKAAQANIAVAKAQGLPSISLSAGPNRQSSDGVSNTSNSIGLNLTIPLFTGFANTYQIRTAQAQAEASALQKEQLGLKIALEVWQSYHNLLTATQTLQATADLLESAEAAEKLALGRYKAGMGNVLDVLNAQSTLASARQQRIQSALDWHVSRAGLAQAMGSLDRGLLNNTSPFPASISR